MYITRMAPSGEPLSSECGSHQIVKARLWLWLHARISVIAKNLRDRQESSWSPRIFVIAKNLRDRQESSWSPIPRPRHDGRCLLPKIYISVDAFYRKEAVRLSDFGSTPLLLCAWRHLCRHAQRSRGGRQALDWKSFSPTLHTERERESKCVCVCVWERESVCARWGLAREREGGHLVERRHQLAPGHLLKH